MDKKLQILLVDDDDDFLLQHRLMLEKAGYSVSTAGSRAEAEQLLASQKPDLAIVDLMMEDVDSGFALCYSIKKDHRDVPVIMCTGVGHETGMAFDAATDEERSWVKADAMLAKPVRFEQLTREIERLIAAKT
ncbi:MAG: hypothetical protein AMXMBFR84_16340 [Candidatus Hydrogenedentota bacterium]